MFSFRPGIRQNTPMIIGLAGPSKSGKTFSALRIAVGLAQGGKIAFINTEGPRGHQYADEFKYDFCDITEPFSMKRYLEAIQEAEKIKPTVLIIDSISHSHEGKGGLLDQHESELDRMAGENYEKRNKMTWAAWVKPKQDEGLMINAMLQMSCHIVLAFRAKEKIKIVKGKDPENLGWQPIASDRIHFETAFTLILPPHSAGTPDLKVSEFRKPYDTIVKAEQLNEDLGKRLAEWAAGGAPRPKTDPPPPPPPPPAPKVEKEDFDAIMARERKRLGDERFIGILGANGYEKVEEITDRKKRINIYRVMVEAK